MPEKSTQSRKNGANQLPGRSLRCGSDSSNGRFQTLEEVIEHYNSGIQAHPGLDAKLKDERGLPRRMNLNALEKKALIAFLHTLTDQSLTREEKFSDPFTN